MEMGLHDDERDVAGAVDEIEYALDAGFLDLAGFAFEEIGEALNAGLQSGGEGSCLAAAPGEQRDGLADEVGDGFAGAALGAEFVQKLAFLGGDTDTELIAFAVDGRHAGLL